MVIWMKIDFHRRGFGRYPPSASYIWDIGHVGKRRNKCSWDFSLRSKNSRNAFFRQDTYCNNQTDNSWEQKLRSRNWISAITLLSFGAVNKSGRKSWMVLDTKVVPGRTEPERPSLTLCTAYWKVLWTWGEVLSSKMPARFRQKSKINHTALNLSQKQKLPNFIVCGKPHVQDNKAARKTKLSTE